MRKIEFRPEQIEQLRYESIHHKQPIVRRRMQVLLLKSQGLAHQEIAKIMGISGTTLRQYLDLYLTNGLAGLKELHYQGQPSVPK
jgi:predicted ArsR family transcriptional regulator